MRNSTHIKSFLRFKLKLVRLATCRSIEIFSTGGAQVGGGGVQVGWGVFRWGGGSSVVGGVGGLSGGRGANVGRGGELNGIILQFEFRF